MKKQIDAERLQKIHLVAFDVDGVFTDGRFSLSDDAIESKVFNTQDGFGIRRLIDSGYEVAVISGRKSKAVRLRMEELGIKHVVLGCSNKVAAFDRLLDQLGLDRTQGAYTGDDVPDLELLQHAGLAFGVANSMPEIHVACDYITCAEGGKGAVREICDLFCQDL